MVIPVGKHTQTMTLFIRTSEKQFEKKEYGAFQFVPLVED